MKTYQILAMSKNGEKKEDKKKRLSEIAKKAIAARRANNPDWGLKKREAEAKRKEKKEAKKENE